VGKPVASLATLVFTMIAGTLCADATTISFSSLSQPGGTFASEGDSYTQQGFTFTDQLNSHFGSGLAAWEASSPNLPGLASSDTSLFEIYAGSTTLLTDAGDAPFTLNSIDLTQYFSDNAAATFDVTFTGTLADNDTVSQTFTVEGSSSTPTLQTFDFTDFSDVISVSFTQGTASTGTAYQFDNVVVNQSSSTPEPHSLSLIMLALAFVGLGTAAGQRRRLTGETGI